MVIFNELMARITGRFGRVEPRRAAGAYVRGLPAGIDRKNCWNLGEAVVPPQTIMGKTRHENPRTAVRYVKPGAEAIAKVTEVLAPPSP
ncbi:hypothetical protein [Nonomuraea sp. GTA35]|uniref:hypothetical protein n=1 Tax=Nonomuraea sp. GTA35 TaxID=1676746 RepID=UPI0035C1DC97